MAKHARNAWEVPGFKARRAPMVVLFTIKDFPQRGLINILGGKVADVYPQIAQEISLIRSSRIWQQTQPLARLMALSSTPTISSLSILIAPKSLTRTATFRPWSPFRMRLSSVVLPEPRKPVSMVSGTAVPPSFAISEMPPEKSCELLGKLATLFINLRSPARRQSYLQGLLLKRPYPPAIS